MKRFITGTIVVFLFFAVTGWILFRADAELREELMRTAVLVVQGLDAVQIESFPFEASDQLMPEYAKAEETMRRRAENVRLSWHPANDYVSVYSMKMQDGIIRFGPESILDTDRRSSPPGTVYRNPPPILTQVFAGRKTKVYGPYKDEYGMFMSAFVPLADASGTPLSAVVGVDVMADAWISAVAYKAIFPCTAMILFSVAAIAWRIVIGGRCVTARPVSYTLMFPLVSVLTLLVVSAGILIWNEYRRAESDRIGALNASMLAELSVDFENAAVGLGVGSELFASAPIVSEAILNDDPGILQSSFAQTFLRLRDEYRLTHLYFWKADRSCLLRVYDPSRRGGKNDRFTMREAERKQQTVWGLELGTKGTLTLRLVRPVFSEGAVAGYVELGKEIEPFLYERKRHSGAHMAVSLHKDTIDRSEWEKSMRAGGRKPFWERYPADVVAYSTSDDLPDLSLFYEPSGVYASTRNGLGETRVRDAAGKLWRASATPLYDASKKDIGDVIVLSEVTASEVSTFRSFAICGAAIVSLLSAFLGYFFVMLRGLDEGIRRQHDALREQSNALTEANDRLSKTVKHAHELADEAARANQAKSRFLANMSHEIRTPLNAIIGFSNVLKGRELSAAHREFLDIIVSSGKLLLSLINDILDLSKIEAGKIVFESLDIDLRRLVSEVVSVVALKTDPTAVRVRTDIDPVVPNALKGDPTRIKQVLLNLGGNAAKFTSSGEIVVSVAYVSASDDAVVLRFSVKDSGIGIPAERVGAIFEVFEQADSSVTRKFGGSGLGLAISRSLVRLMGGELSVVSEAGKGSDFFFTLSLPLGHRGDAVQTLPQAQASRRLDGTRFLVAEDVLTNRQLIDVILSGWGATMTFVENGQEALSALRHGGYDLCLMDVQMPVMSGLQAAIAARGEGITVPIIALTASASVESSTECRDAGMDAFVPKPIDEDDLWRTIQRVLRR